MAQGDDIFAGVERQLTELGDAPVVVKVRNRFDGSWSPGFEIVEIAEGPRFRLRRRSDGFLLPAWFTADELTAHRP